MLNKKGNMKLLEINCNPSLNVMKAGSTVEKSEIDVDIKMGLMTGTSNSLFFDLLYHINYFRYMTLKSLTYI